MKKQWIAMTGCLATCVLLQGCVNMAVTGAQAVYHHRSIQKSVGDQVTTLQAFRAIGKEEKYFEDASIHVATFNKDVLLSGQAPSIEQKEEAEKVIKKIPGVDRIYNFVEIAEPISAIRHMKDTWITAKVKSQMIASNEMDASQIKVITEDGTVYLMGVIKPEEADSAVHIARTTTGVMRVVKMFSYVHITRA